MYTDTRKKGEKGKKEGMTTITYIHCCWRDCTMQKRRRWRCWIWFTKDIVIVHKRKRIERKERTCATCELKNEKWQQMPKWWNYIYVCIYKTWSNISQLHSREIRTYRDVIFSLVKHTMITETATWLDPPFPIDMDFFACFCIF